MRQVVIGLDHHGSPAGCLGFRVSAKFIKGNAETEKRVSLVGLKFQRAAEAGFCFTESFLFVEG